MSEKPSDGESSSLQGKPYCNVAMTFGAIIKCAILLVSLNLVSKLPMRGGLQKERV